jgi:soluble lytic murein transglycosylase-like protein
MVFPSGIQSITQRIETIRRHLDAMENGAQIPGDVPENGKSFGRILNDKLAPTTGTPVTDVNSQHLEDMVETQAQRVGLDPSLAKAVVKAESGFNPDAVSPAGAKGLMQLMPATAQSLGVKAILDPVENVQGGTQYLKSLMEKYHSIPNALAAYNAGPGAVDQHGGIPPYRETQNYVKRVLQYQQQYQAQDAE